MQAIKPIWKGKNWNNQKPNRRKQRKKHLLQPEDKQRKSLKKKGRNCYL